MGYQWALPSAVCRGFNLQLRQMFKLFINACSVDVNVWKKYRTPRRRLLRKNILFQCEGELGAQEIVLIDSNRRSGTNGTVNNTMNHGYKLSNDIYKNIVESNATSNYSLIDRIYRNVVNSQQRMPTRRSGICQVITIFWKLWR